MLPYWVLFFGVAVGRGAFGNAAHVFLWHCQPTGTRPWWAALGTMVEREQRGCSPAPKLCLYLDSIAGNGIRLAVSWSERGKLAAPAWGIPYLLRHGRTPPGYSPAGPTTMATWERPGYSSAIDHARLVATAQVCGGPSFPQEICQLNAGRNLRAYRSCPGWPEFRNLPPGSVSALLSHYPTHR
jgi:hypothetical protein